MTIAATHATADFQMWVTFGLIIGALAFYVRERASMELTSLGIVCVLLVFFHFFPVSSADGVSRVTPVRILQGFANPVLIAVLALLVIGQGMVRTGVLDRGAAILLDFCGRRGGMLFALAVLLIVAMAISAFLNNIPVMVIFIPILQVLAARYGRSASKLLIPLSFAAVSGGMTTLIGSSTNLLVNSALIEMKSAPFGFFDFSVPGLVMAGVGLIYVLFAAPLLLPDRSGLVDQFAGGSGRQFVAQMTLGPDSELIGERARGGEFKALPGKTLRTVYRGETAILPPFEDFAAQAGDVLVVAAPRHVLAKSLSNDPESFHPSWDDGEGDVPAKEGGATEEPRWTAGEQVLAR